MTLILKWTASIITVMVFVNVTDCVKWPSSEKTNAYEHIQLFNRGQFKRKSCSAKSQETPNSLDQAKEVAAIGKEIKCNEAYYMLSYLHLTNPHNLSYPEQVVSLNEAIKTLYPEWARKMLATAFNVAQNDAEMDVAWLMYLYVMRIEVHATNDPDKEFLPVMQTAHYGMYKLLLHTMSKNDCTMFDRKTKRERKFPEYLDDMKRWNWIGNDFSENSATVKGLLGKHWLDLCLNSSVGCFQEESDTSGPVPGVRPLTEEHLTLDLLYLNDVFENTSMAITLLTDFGVLANGRRLLVYLKDKITEIKSGRTPFEQYVLSLVDFHEHVVGTLYTIVLRIYYEFLEKLKIIKWERRGRRVKQFFKSYKQWCVFLHLPKKFKLYARLSPKSPSYECTFFGGDIIELQHLIISSLNMIDKQSKVHLDNNTPESLLRIKINTPRLMYVARKYKIPICCRLKCSRKNPTRPTVLCAKVLIGFIKKIFTNVHFKAIHSLVKLGTSTNFQRFCEYGQQYHSNAFSREDEPNSI